MPLAQKKPFKLINKILFLKKYLQSSRKIVQNTLKIKIQISLISTHCNKSTIKYPLYQKNNFTRNFYLAQRLLFFHHIVLKFKLLIINSKKKKIPNFINKIPTIIDKVSIMCKMLDLAFTDLINFNKMNIAINDIISKIIMNRSFS